MLSRRKSRILAMQAIYAWDAAGKQSESILSDFSWFNSPSPEEGEFELQHVFAKNILFGTVETVDIIDALLQRHIKNWNFDRLNKVDLSILRTSVYALLYVKDVPASITIDEAIDIAKEYSDINSFKFVNGVLDSIRKEMGV